MKPLNFGWLILGVLFLSAGFKSAYAGIIPYSLVESEQENSCKNLQHKNTQIEKKISKLEREEERNITEIQKNQCRKLAA